MKIFNVGACISAMMQDCIPTAKTADNIKHHHIMNLTPQQLVQQHIAEIKRLASVEPAPAYIQGALEYTLEAVIKRFPEASQWLESRIEYSQSQPTPTR